ncbi:MAG: Uncharacterised protein [Cryomorphaceae bacterium]|nr:MAG: Uncharacterised protein [Cryomorphaceae bacterium]
MPESGLIKLATKLARVDLPEPEEPTKAVTEPLLALKVMLRTTSFPFS